MEDTKLTKMIKAIVRETISKNLVSQHGIDGIISTGYCVFSKNHPSVFHSPTTSDDGSTTWLSSKLHQVL
jgi:hypothetical protein